MNAIKNDPWRKAILAERSHPYAQPLMLKGLQYVQEKSNALILGDACLVQSKFLLDGFHFRHVVNVDSSVSLLDDEVVSLSEQRLKRIVTSFDQYQFPSVKCFNFVYGKSIAFNPHETTGILLSNIRRSLLPEGVFAAVWASSSDTFRRIRYSENEITNLYSMAGLRIISVETRGPAIADGLLGGYGIVDEIQIIAR